MLVAVENASIQRAESWVALKGLSQSYRVLLNSRVADGAACAALIRVGNRPIMPSTGADSNSGSDVNGSSISCMARDSEKPDDTDFPCRAVPFRGSLRANSRCRSDSAASSLSRFLETISKPVAGPRTGPPAGRGGLPNRLCLSTLGLFADRTRQRVLKQLLSEATVRSATQAVSAAPSSKSQFALHDKRRAGRSRGAGRNRTRRCRVVCCADRSWGCRVSLPAAHGWR